MQWRHLCMLGLPCEAVATEKAAEETEITISNGQLRGGAPRAAAEVGGKFTGLPDERGGQPSKFPNISVVGDGIGANSSKLQSARKAAKNADIAIVAISTSPLRVSLFCDEEHVDKLCQTLHREFIDRDHEKLS